jgi:hypothetical protein
MKNENKVIAVTTLTILAISFLYTSNVFAQGNGVIQIQIQGPKIGDNLKISAYTFQNSWEWNDTFTIDNTFVKQVDKVSDGDIVNVCVKDLKEGKEGCSSGTFNSNSIANINIEVGS